MGANGGNPRLDRIEKIIEEIGKAHREGAARHDREMAEGAERHDREMAAIRESAAEQARESHRLDLRLSRAIKLGLAEARRHRNKMLKMEAKIAAADLEFDEKMTQLASAQLLTEEVLKRFLARSGNGHGRQ